jgi:hypothetical protein
MENYEPLTAFLKSQSTNEVTVTFDELEDSTIVGIALPAYARTHRQWWENQVSMDGRQCHAWLNAGWSVKDVKLGEGRVVFGRSTLTFRLDAGNEHPDDSNGYYETP